MNEAALSWKGEICRKAIHLSALSIPLSYFLFRAPVVIIVLGIALVLSAIFDLLRIFGHPKVRYFLGINFGFLLRPREKRSFSGSTTIILAGLLVYLFYDMRVAAASMVIIVIGDVAAALIGRTFGRVKVYYKSLEGTLAFVVFTSLAVTFVPGLDLRVAAVGVIVGAVIELLPLPVDDNISVPLISGGVMQLVINQQLMLSFLREGHF